MTTTVQTGPEAPPDPRRWWALGAVATAQLMVGIDLTIVNIALPSAQRDLGMSDPTRQWVVTIFALTYGGLLLLGGRLSDLAGRRRMLVIGLAGFALASALGGIATGPATLLAGRALQGAFGAMLTPAVLGTLGATFPAPAERGRAFGLYGTVMGSSSGLGVIAGGLLTDYLDWRWCMFVNLPIAVIAGAGVLYAVRPAPRHPDARLDVPGAVLATAGLMALVFGFSRAETDGWGAGTTLAALAAGLVLLAAFVVTQTRVAAPLLPLRVVLDRRRGACYLAVLSLSVGMFAVLFFLTFYLQDVRGWSPVRTGLGFLPITAGLMVGVRLVGRLLARAPVRALLAPGILTVGAGVALLALVHPGSGYAAHVLPVLLLVGLGGGWTLVAANSTATLGAGADTGTAGAMVMTSQQIGASLGTALLSTVAGTVAVRYLHTHPGAAAAAAVHGFNIAAAGAAAFLAVMALTVHTIAGRR
ncbi:MFS transporter [Actinomadura parmotrematis]|uniref:MFS transporter n=1 Tax=Actinomadura parmotrematis TaxID=2864039 RepID=A0ABS7FYM2_9ACTN|nr:MFS transporter [Actinomadura parmotrematis]MBW8484538.1 MFS transporter [Actinomadura parmotrematis]